MALKIAASVKNVFEGSEFSTYFEIYVTDPPSPLPGAAESIAITAPISGLLPYGVGDFTYTAEEVGKLVNRPIQQFFLKIPGQPEIGTYTFDMVIDGTPLSETDDQDENELIPFPTNLLPVDGASLPGGEITFSWDEIDSQYPKAVYGIEIRDDLDRDVVDTRQKKNKLNHSEVLSAGNYKWRLILEDHQNWKQINNRSNSPWRTFTVV